MKKLFSLTLAFSLLLSNLTIHQNIYAMDKELSNTYLNLDSDKEYVEIKEEREGKKVENSSELNLENNVNEVQNDTLIIPEDNQSIYNVYISDTVPTAKRANKYQVDFNDADEKFSLNKEGQTIYYEKAILAKPDKNSYSSIYYTDIQESGYTSFIADYGIDTKSQNTDAEVEFKVYVDGENVFSSGTVTGSTPAGRVEIPLTDAKVLQLVVDSKGGNANDNAIWANAHFTRENYTPYLEVYDLEFNLPSQVTRSNILEYVTAHDDNNVDLTESVTYETNYNGEKQGEFYVEYSVKDASENIHTRTVKLTVTGEDYTKNLTTERLKQPWTSYLYHGRGTLSTQGKKAWDIVLKEVLDFNSTKWNLINRWGENVYAVQINLQENNIFVKKNEISSLGYMLMDDEPRTFIMKDWNCDITEKDGLAEKVTIWIVANATSQEKNYKLSKLTQLKCLKNIKKICLMCKLYMLFQ